MQFHLVFNDLFETVIRTDIDDLVVESICTELFQLNRELFAEEELDEAGNVIYQSSSLHEVWLDKAGRRQGPITDNGTSIHICLDKIQLIMGIGYNIHNDYENSNVLIINDGIDTENFIFS